MADLFNGEDGQALHLSQALNTIAYVLRGLEYQKTLQAFQNEAKEFDIAIRMDDPKELGSTTHRLDLAVANILYAEAARKAMIEASAATAGDESSVVSSDSESDSASSSEESVKPGDKRKREVSPEDSSSDSSSDSDSTSSSDSGSESDSSSDDNRPLKRAKHEGSDEKKALKKKPGRSNSDSSSDENRPLKRGKHAGSGGKKVVKKNTTSSSSDSSSSDASDSDSSSSDGSSSSSSDSGSSSASGSDKSSSNDSSSSSSDSGSESSSPSPSPPPKQKKQKSKAKKAEKAEKAKKGKGAQQEILSSGDPQKSVSNESAASSVTLTATSPQQPASNIVPSPDTMLVLDTGVTQVPATAENVKLLKDKATFKRVPMDTAVDPRFSSNAYIPYDYANRAYQDLSVTKGKGFTKEKNKKKRGAYRGGAIDTTPKAIKFDD